jgi:branched-chain amino acid transport system permease protein
MLYRENGQFKTTYRSDQQIFPILQDGRSSSPS